MSTRLLQVKVKPGARQSRLVPSADGQSWVADVKAPPVDGRANLELIGLVAAEFGCRRSDVSIQRGSNGRLKLVRIED